MAASLSLSCPAAGLVLAAAAASPASCVFNPASCCVVVLSSTYWVMLVGGYCAALLVLRYVAPAATGGLNYLAVLDTAADVAKAMLHLHSLNVLHSDL